jgi:coproporphyrinogen III oxidase
MHSSVALADKTWRFNMVLQHRGERRGLGGIFFDDLNDRDAEKILAFSTGTTFETFM